MYAIKNTFDNVVLQNCVSKIAKVILILSFRFRISNELKILKVNFITRRAHICTCIFRRYQIRLMFITNENWCNHRICLIFVLGIMRCVALQNSRPRFIKWNGSRRRGRECKKWKQDRSSNHLQWQSSLLKICTVYICRRILR